MFLKTLSISNFRVFKEFQHFEFKPITILVGSNDSGKSSVMKALSLLSGKSLFTLNFNEGTHRLGTYNSCLNDKNRDLSVEMKFDEHIYFKNPPGAEETLGLDALMRNRLGLLHLKFKIDYSVLTPEIAVANHFQVSVLKNEIIKESIDFINFKMYKEGEFDAFYFFINLPDLLCLTHPDFKKISTTTLNQNSSTTPFLIENIENYFNFSIVDSIAEKHEITLDSDIKQYLAEKVLLQIGTLDIKKSKDRENFSLPYTLTAKSNPLNAFGAYINTYDMYFEIGIADFWNKIISDEIHQFYLESKVEISEKHFDFLKALNNIMLNDLIAPETIAIIYKRVEHLFEKIEKVDINGNFQIAQTIKPVSERIYLKENSEIGQLLSKFYNIESSEKNKLFLEKWLKEFEIGENLEIDRIEGTVSAPYIKLNENRINLADLGTGSFQIVMLIIRLMTLNSNVLYRYLLVIEEPETNLHPNKQSKLAEFFIEAQKLFNAYFILETHSEYFIRGLQHCVAGEKIKNTEVAIYNFRKQSEADKDESDKAIVQNIEFSSNGKLNRQFYRGFVDEIPRLIIDLLKHISKN